MMEKKLIIIAAATVAIIIIYFIASPYQNCKRDLKKAGFNTGTVMAECTKRKTW